MKLKSKHFLLFISALFWGIASCYGQTTEKYSEEVLLKIKSYVLHEHDSATFWVNELKKWDLKAITPLEKVRILEIEGLHQEINENNLSSATQKYLTAVQICKENKLEYIRNIYHNLGILFHTIDEFEKAESYYQKTIQEAQLTKDSVLLLKSNINLGSIYSSLGNYPRAVNYFDNALKYKPDFEQKRSINSNLGNLYLRKNEPKKALDYLKNTIAKNPESQEEGGPLDYSFLLDVKTNLGDTVELKQIILKSEALCKKTKNTRDRSILLKSISNAWETLKQYQKASDFKNLYIQTYDTLVVEQRDKIIYELETQYATKQKEEALEIQIREKNRLLWISSFAGLVILVLSYLIITNEKQRKKLNLQKNQLEILVEEKNTLMKETHHRVKNSFQIVSSLLYLQSENIHDKEAALAVKEAQNRVKSMILIHQKLYSKDQLVGIDSKEYIEDLVNDIIENQSDNIENLIIIKNIESKIFSIDTITPIGLIINELITNVIKYAFPDKIQNPELNVSFLKKDTNYELKVSDNGIGISNQNNPDSFGLKLIHSLAKKLKASVTFENNNGTTVTLLISKFEELN